VPASRNRQVRLKTRPIGEPKPDDFEYDEALIAGPGDGQVPSRTIYLSLDPYMRGRMNEGDPGDAIFGLLLHLFSSTH
jgi:NADPH-dependent curcumin reductase CurA